MAYFKKIETDELYLYMNGKLIYKRWLKTGQSQVFDVMAYDKYTLTSFRGEVQYFNSFKELFLVKAKLKLIPTEDGGRKRGIFTGYRPNHVFEYNEWNQILQTFIGDVILDEQTSIEPGEEKEVTIRFLLNQPIEKHLVNGRKWWIHEGSRRIGEAEIIHIMNTESQFTNQVI